MLSVFIRSVIVASVFAQGIGSQLKKLQETHTARELSNIEVKYLAGLSNIEYTNDVLDNILIPRVVGTPNHEKVFNYIKEQLQNLSWNVEVDEFDDKAPQFGQLTFKNIIATLNPNADRYLVLACHYDSKYFENDEFVGATDSAVPCAMMLNIARVMQTDLNKIKTKSVSLKLIFLDGEEAFVRWGPNDSLYGARHLADVYNKNRQETKGTRETVSDLERIDMFVLLDLIGHKQTAFYSYFDNTQNWYLRLASAEDKLDNLRLLQKAYNERYFLKRALRAHIEDDHIPFLKKNVPILHLISHPFPAEWHTPGDNRDIVDMATVENINKILRVFVAEYLNIYLKDAAEELAPEKEL